MDYPDRKTLTPPKRRVIVVGGTGFLGTHAILEFLRQGWEVTALGLPPAPPASRFPTSVRIVLRDLDQTPDTDLLELFVGQDALVFAAGLDDRVTPRRPAYPTFQHANVEIPVRLLNLAKQAGIRRAVVLGSYFAHFDRLWPEMRLSERHPYIRSRVEQEQAVGSIPGLDVDVLELPYIFGDPFGRIPLWAPLVRYLRSSPVTFYPKGGSACISAETVGRAVVAAVDHGTAGTRYPIGDENLSWPELLSRLGRADGRRVRVVTLPTGLIRAGLLLVWLLHRFQGREAGLNLRYFSDLQTANAFLDPEPSRRALGYTPGNLDEALRKTVAAC